MKRLIFLVLLILGLLWSGLCWLLFKLAGAGSVAVVAVTRWLDFEPSSTQWLADGLAAAGGIAQAVVGLIWLLGAGALAVVALLVRKATPELPQQPAYRPMDPPGQTIEGEVRSRRTH